MSSSLLKSSLRVYNKNVHRMEIKGNWDSFSKKLLIVPVINVEIYSKSGLSIQPHLAKNNPDIANSGWRDYGNRNGLPRLIDIMNEHEIDFDVAINSDALIEEPYILDSLGYCNPKDYSITAHGISNSFLLPTDDDDRKQEAFTKEYVKETLKVIEKITSIRPKGWLSPGFSIPSYLNECLCQEGLQYTMDCCDDDFAYATKVVKKSRPSLLFDGENDNLKEKEEQIGELICIPYSMETNDVTLCISQNKSNAAYAEALVDTVDQLITTQVPYRTENLHVLCLGLHTFIAGQPGRSLHLSKALEIIRSKFSKHIKFCHMNTVMDCIQKGRLKQ